MRRTLRGLATAAPLLLAAACASAPRRHATSVVDYLYPNRSDLREQPSIPVLKLPLRVGIAFVPSADRSARTTTEGIPEADRQRLLRDVSDGFKAQPFVKSIEVIPSAYLTPQGGFANLDQLQSMFDADVVALVSYDQVQFNDQKRLSLTYLTVVGAYLVNGEKNDTRTLMDAVVYDIRSRKLLFRAPGTSTVKGTASPVNLEEALRKDSQKGFELAATDLKANLSTQLEQFKQRVRESPAEFTVERTGTTGGGTGAGAVDGYLLAAISVLLIAALMARRDQRAAATRRDG